MKHLILLISLIVMGGVWSQDLSIPIQGRITDQDNGSKLGGVTITLLHNGSPISTAQTSSNGRYSIQGSGPKSGKYEIVYSKPGMVSKRISFDFSDVNVEDLPAGNQIPVPPLDIDLFAERENVDFSFLDKEPVASFYWDQKDFVLDFDRSASSRVKKKIDNLLNEAEKEAAEKEEKYNQAVIAGDMFFEQKQYEKAVEKYEEALSYKPKEEYPAEKLIELDALIQAQKQEELAQAQADARYNELIKDADGLRDSDKLEAAVMKYEEAVREKDEQYPKDQIRELKELIEKRKKEAANQAKYDAAIEEAEKLLNEEKLEQSKAKFQEASGLKPSEQYPKDKIKEIQALIDKKKNEAELNRQYDAAIKEADAFFANKNFEKAKEKYEVALNLKSDEQYPKDQILLCNEKIDELKESAEKNAQIAEFMSKGDKAMQKSEYQEAIDNYKEVLNLDAGHQGAKDKIKVAEQKLNDLKSKEELEANFNDLVTKGDQAMSSEEYDKAIENYQEALKLKSSTPVEAKLTDAQAKLKALQADKQKREEYERLMSEGASAMTASKWVEAKSKYQQASTLFPEEQEPKNKLKEIEDKLKNNEAQAEIDREYKKHMDAGDELMKNKDYLAAIQEYNAALGLKPNEKEPVEKAAEAQRLEEEASRDSDKQYEKIITTAEKKAESGDYDGAVELIDRAKKFRPSDPRPDELLDRIKELRARDAEYEKLMSAGNDLAAKKAYEDARAKFVAARDLKPDEQLPKDKIDEMDKLIAESSSAAEREALYQEYMREGQSKENSRNYEEALTAYKNALNVKAGDTKAQNKVNEIQQILDDLANKEASEKEKKEKFEAIIREADQLFDDENYLDAKDKYEDALAIYPTDGYAQRKRDESIRLEQKKTGQEEEEQYRNLIAAADKNFDEENYDKAKDYYTRAINVRSSDPYPKKRLEEIESILNPVVQKSDELEDPGIPFTGSILDGETLLQQAERQRKQAKTQGVVKVVDDITTKESAMQESKQEEHLSTTNQIYEIQKQITLKTVDDDKNLHQNAELIKKSIEDLELEHRDDMEFEHQDLLGTQSTLTTIDESHRLEYKEKHNVYLDNTELVDAYNIAQEKSDSQKSNAEKGTNIYADQKLTTITSGVQSDVIDNYDEREKVTREVEAVEKRAQNQITEAHQKEYASNLETNVVVEGIEKNVEERYEEGKLITNNNNEELKKVAESIIKNEEGRVDEDVQLNYRAKEIITEIEENVEDRFEEGVTVSTENNKEVKKIDNDLVAKESYMNEVETSSLRKKDIEVQGKVEEATKAQEGIAENRKENANYLDEVTKDFEDDQRKDYNEESEKYLSNVNAIQNSIDENSEINEVADEAMEKKIEYSERMEKRSIQKTESFQDADDQSRINAKQTIDNIELDYSANEASEAKRTLKNAPIVENIEISMADANKIKGNSEKDEHYKAKEQIDQISDKPPKKTVVVNSLGKEYPEGVSQEVFTKQDQNGLMTQLITRRIVVIDGHADVYLRTQTSHGTTYTKNGEPSLEHVWQAETQNPHLERHF